MYSPSFELVEWNLATVGLPGKTPFNHPWKIHYMPPIEKNPSNARGNKYGFLQCAPIKSCIRNCASSALGPRSKQQRRFDLDPRGAPLRKYPLLFSFCVHFVKMMKQAARSKLFHCIRSNGSVIIHPTCPWESPKTSLRVSLGSTATPPFGGSASSQNSSWNRRIGCERNLNLHKSASSLRGQLSGKGLMSICCSCLSPACE